MGRTKNQGSWPPSGFGARLEELRAKADLTRAELAAAAGIGRSTVYNLEHGEQEPAWPLVLALAEALGVSTEDFRGNGGGAPKRPRGRPRKET